MSSTDSDTPKKVDAIPSELVVGMARNGWTASIGINGRHGLDYALTAVLALLGAAGFGVGTFLIDVFWSSAFRFNATFGLPVSRFVERDVRFASCTAVIILFYALQLEGRGT
jgi:hypothetical protein